MGGSVRVVRGGCFMALVVVAGQLPGRHDRDRGHPGGVLGETAHLPLERVEDPKDDRARRYRGDRPERHFLDVGPVRAVGA